MKKLTWLVVLGVLVGMQAVAGRPDAGRRRGPDADAGAAVDAGDEDAPRNGSEGCIVVDDPACDTGQP